MIQYLLECMAFHLVFLITYDFWLKGETFFQWNRVYLIGTFVLSMVLPWVKIEAFKTIVSDQYYVYSSFLWKLDPSQVSIAAAEKGLVQLTWQQGAFLLGMLLAALLFAYKFYQLYRLRKQGQIYYYADFTKVVISNSQMAFSFFRSIFLGDQVVGNEKNIIEHELVHIKQKHSWDLLFFELMRILCWYNPLVYVYQGRISELHEYIADAHVAKAHKNEQYELMLSQVFQTQRISFINQFLSTSLIKKRIVMLQKAKSKKIFRLKYLLLVPMISAMLFYSSCQNEGRLASNDTIVVEDIENMTSQEERTVFDRLIALSGSTEDWQLYVRDEGSSMKFVKSNDGSYISGPNNEKIWAKLAIDSKFNPGNSDLIAKSLRSKYYELLTERNRLLKNVDENNPIIINLNQQMEELKKQFISNNPASVSFGSIDEVPIFPGCENITDKRACFNESIQKHISKHFNYPQEAQEKGIQGRVNIMFTITVDGAISDIKVRGPDQLLEAEAERIISRLPHMNPGKQNGKPVNVPFSIPITFKLQ